MQESKYDWPTIAKNPSEKEPVPWRKEPVPNVINIKNNDNDLILACPSCGGIERGGEWFRRGDGGWVRIGATSRGGGRSSCG